MKRAAFVTLAAAFILGSCGPSSSDPQRSKDQPGVSDSSADSISRDNNMQEEHSKMVQNAVVFTVDDKEYTFELQKTGGMYLKSASGHLMLNFIASDLKASMSIMIKDFGKVKGPMDIPLSGSDAVRDNFVMYIPVLES